MGEPKAGLVLEGRTLLERAVATARSAGLRPVVVAKAGSPLPGVDAERWTEPDEPRHPLAGIVAALAAGGAEGIVALACDTPLVGAQLLGELAARPAATIVRTPDGRLHPLPGRYPASARAPLAAALAAGAPLQRALLDLGAEILEVVNAEALLNVNRPADLERARVVLAVRGQR